MKSNKDNENKIVAVIMLVIGNESDDQENSTRQSLKVDPRGPAISNLLHPYLLLPRTDRAHVTNQKMVIKQAARARILARICEIGACFRGASF